MDFKENISVVMPAYNEEEGVGDVVSSFNNMGIVDEVVVADNNSTDRTAEIAEENGATVVHENQQGYGYAMKTALQNASNDLVVTVESDQSYNPSDIYKLLAYREDADIVFGDRTNPSMIREGAKMGSFLRIGNRFLGRALQLLFKGPRVTDVGCSFRLFRREALDKILEHDVRGPNLYATQLLVEPLKHDMDIVLIPVNYLERAGESKLTNTIPKSAVIGLNIFRYIIFTGLIHRVRS